MDPQAFDLLKESIDNLREDVGSLRSDMNLVVVQMSKYKGFLAGVCSVFTAFGTGIVTAMHYLWNTKT